jgi:hypothetical protein
VENNPWDEMPIVIECAAAVHTTRHVSPTTTTRKRCGGDDDDDEVAAAAVCAGNGCGKWSLGVYGVGAWRCEREKEKSEREREVEERVENRWIHPTASLRFPSLSFAFLRL